MFEQVLYAVHIKCQRESQRLVEGVAAGGRDDIAHIKREHIHLEAATYGEVFQVALLRR